MLRAEFPLKRPVLVVSDYPVQNEVDRDIPYSGASNLDMLNGLAKAGIKQSEMNRTYLSYERPSAENFEFCKSFTKLKGVAGSAFNWVKLEHQKDCYVEESLYQEIVNLVEEIRSSEAKLVIVTGKLTFFLLSGLSTLSKTIGSGSGDKPLGGLATYRASVTKIAECWNLPDVILYPMLPPVTKHRMPEKAPIMVWDSLKAGDIYRRLESNEKSVSDYINPNYRIIYGTDDTTIFTFFKELDDALEKGVVKVSVDIETRHYTIDCIGLGFKKGEAICIPFSTIDSPNFWSAEQELGIVRGINKRLTHPNCKIIGQNFSYDAQFLWKFWLAKFHAGLDTMIASHCMHNKMQKSLDFLASIYCETYVYWKSMQQHNLEDISK